MGTRVRPLLPTPKKGELPFAKNLDKEFINAAMYLPDLVKDLGFDKIDVEAQKDNRASYDFIGGEDEGIKRCKEYIWETMSVGHYATTRNEIMGANYSSKISPWLACGALSVRYVFYETIEYEDTYFKVESTQKFIDELLWRDFCKFWCLKHGVKVFSVYGF